MLENSEFWLSVFGAVERHEGTLSSICTRFGISRQTYYVYHRRFETEGIAGLKRRSTRPHSMPARIPEEIEMEIVRIREEKPWLGARAIRTAMEYADSSRSCPLPAVSTIARVLKRNGFDHIQYAEPVSRDDEMEQ